MAQKIPLEEIILKTVGAAGLVAVALLAPNALSAMSKLGFIPSKRQREYIHASKDRLLKRGLLKYENGKLLLTRSGEDRLRRLKILDYQFKKPYRWDRKWRVLIFDVPEKRKSLRNKIRETLLLIGFRHLQDSVWIYPYDCEDIVTLLKADFRIGKDLLYMVVEKLEYDRSFREYFDLT